MENGKTRLLIVDDSLVFRKAVEAALGQDISIDITGSVRNGKLALEEILKNPPDIVTLDLEMPEMDGLATLHEIKKLNSENREHAVSVIMLSAFTREGAETTMKALEAGAFDFITKPESPSFEENISGLRKELMRKIAGWRSHSRKPHAREFVKPPPKTTTTPNTPSGINAIIIGVSTGGPKALNEMLPDLCKVTNLPILIVQHMPPTFTKSLAEQLDKKCTHTVVEGSDNTEVKEKFVYIAPGGRHMTVKSALDSKVISINDMPPEGGCRPSVNMLFRSAADSYGSKCLGIILTGMGNDGTIGSGVLRRTGARIIAQDAATSTIWGMPGSAAAAGNVDYIKPLMEIPSEVERLINLMKVNHGNK